MGNKTPRTGMTRNRLRYPIDFSNDVVYGWTINTINSNYWRAPRHYSKEDLIQEAWIKFEQCRRRYANTVDNDKWFMALYKRAFINHLHNLSRVASRSKVVEPFTEIEDDEDLDFIEQIPDPVGNYGSAAASLRNAPVEVKRFLQCLGDDQMVRKLRKPRVRIDGVRESNAEYYSRVLGLDNEVDVLEQLREFLQ